MDPDLAPVFRSLKFSWAAGISLGLLIRLWWIGELYGRSGLAFCVWFVAATAAQMLGTTTGVWAVGLAAQTLLAIVLILKARLSEIS